MPPGQKIGTCLVHGSSLTAAIALVFQLGASPCCGEVVTDGSLGPPAQTLSGPSYSITHDLGQTRGNNLFHSFGQFNLLSGESATFSGPDSIDNVISRVPGGSQSQIDGILRSTIGGANVWGPSTWHRRPSRVNRDLPIN